MNPGSFRNRGFSGLLSIVFATHAAGRLDRLTFPRQWFEQHCQVSWLRSESRCQVIGSKALGSTSAPAMTASQSATAPAAQTAAARKKGRNPWRRIAGPAAARRAEFDALAATTLELP